MSSSLRERLDHPVIDADGHTIEFMPQVAEYCREVAGAEVAHAMTRRVRTDSSCCNAADSSCCFSGSFKYRRFLRRKRVSRTRFVNPPMLCPA